MFSHPNPKRVLIIGGGDGGVVREVAKHSGVEEIVQCEIDGQVIELAKQFFSTSTATANDDPRLTLIIGDAAKYVLWRVCDGVCCVVCCVVCCSSVVACAAFLSSISSPHSPLILLTSSSHPPHLLPISSSHPSHVLPFLCRYVLKEEVRDSFDVVIVDSSDPVGPAEVRETLGDIQCSDSLSIWREVRHFISSFIFYSCSVTRDRHDSHPSHCVKRQRRWCRRIL